ncbi:FtsJ-like methyltransferase-domain-containing protein [Diaporthe sp. PMI_573]|nr:FtsJ-like methyltransferase-domain-containing protein [Diaporthaceae sp. PMI_573]
MATALGGASCRRVALSEQLVSRVLSQLTLGPAAPASSNALSNPHACRTCRLRPLEARRNSSSSSQWKSRQSKDRFARQAKVQGMKSRAAWKLMEMNDRYGLFRRNQTVVDLGYAPGSWSQVAKDATGPNGVVVGIDLIPAQPPRGVTSIQGDFLSPRVRTLVKDVLVEQVKRRERNRKERQQVEAASSAPERTDAEGEVAEASVVPDQPSYIDQEKQATQDIEAATGAEEEEQRMVDVSCVRGLEATGRATIAPISYADTRRPFSSYADVLLTHEFQVVISDMSEPWPQTSGFSSRTLSNPHRLMNTSGINFKDHAGSMDLCYAALTFASDTLKIGGHFVCKFYQGAEDKRLQKLLEKMFTKVHREKPESSRSDSKEAYFVALKRLDFEFSEDELN